MDKGYICTVARLSLFLFLVTTFSRLRTPLESTRSLVSIVPNLFSPRIWHSILSERNQRNSRGTIITSYDHGGDEYDAIHDNNISTYFSSFELGSIRISYSLLDNQPYLVSWQTQKWFYRLQRFRLLLLSCFRISRLTAAFLATPFKPSPDSNKVPCSLETRTILPPPPPPRSLERVTRIIQRIRGGNSKRINRWTSFETE